MNKLRTGAGTPEAHATSEQGTIGQSGGPASSAASDSAAYFVITIVGLPE